MLETLTREIRPGITVTVREPSNADFYAARRLYERLTKPDDDEDLLNLKSRFVLIATRTISMSGDKTIDLAGVSANTTNDELETAFQSFMAMPQKLTEAWVELASEVGSTAPKN